MITIDRTTPYRPIRSIDTKSVARTSRADEVEVDASSKNQLLDRRKNPDRRRHRKGAALLETRSGNDRRKNKNLRRPSIDIEA